MKKIILISILILGISFSLISGTLAMYTISLDDIASGSVTGKEFVFVEDGINNFEQNVKIAPTERVIWEFGVSNHEGATISETDLYYLLSINVSAANGKQAIDPLTVTVKNESSEVVKTITGTGNIDISGEFPLSGEGQRAGYTVEIFWPSDNDVDINYAGDNFGTAINVSAVASQIPFGEDPGGENPGDPGDEDPQTNAEVLYQTGESWTEGGYWDSDTGSMQGGVTKHKFEITIKNTSTTAIENWNISMIFPGQIYNSWEARLISSENGVYVFDHPVNYNKIIAPGGSISFGGNAVGNGIQPISDVIVNGIPATVICEYNVNGL